VLGGVTTPQLKRKSVWCLVCRAPHHHLTPIRSYFPSSYAHVTLFVPIYAETTGHIRLVT
jgi:hypothetical protein